MSDAPLHVLFLCTGNTARSILAESLLRQRGEGRFVAHSAGSRPKGEVHPLALELLRKMNLPIRGLRSKSWEEFAAPGAPSIDFVFTLCAAAAGESCPVWPGRPMTAHWGIADPAAVGGPTQDQQAAFRKAFGELERRIEAFTALPIRALDNDRLQELLAGIGRPTST